MTTWNVYGLPDHMGGQQHDEVLIETVEAESEREARVLVAQRHPSAAYPPHLLDAHISWYRAEPV